MRPRVFPAEDQTKRLSNPAGRRASMRPRVFPAEDLLDVHQPVSKVELRASMRPRVFPAEDIPQLPTGFVVIAQLQ